MKVKTLFIVTFVVIVLLAITDCDISIDYLL